MAFLVKKKAENLSRQQRRYLQKRSEKEERARLNKELNAQRQERFMTLKAYYKEPPNFLKILFRPDEYFQAKFVARVAAITLVSALVLGIGAVVYNHFNRYRSVMEGYEPEQTLSDVKTPVVTSTVPRGYSEIIKPLPEPEFFIVPQLTNNELYIRSIIR